MKAIFLRSPFNYDMMAASNASGLECQDDSRTKQSFSEESDINTIVKRFGLTGKLPENVRMPQYGDFLEAADYQTSLNVVLEAQDGFMKMPAHVRSRFHNDPAAFLEFLGKEENRAEAEKLGVVVARAPVETPLVPAVPVPDPKP